jgi:ethanolamine ammonia-lyase small subunit
MTDDLVKRLRDGWTEDGVSNEFDEDVLLISADRIEELEAALRDLAQYVSSADLGFYIEPETKKVLSEIGEKKDD